MRPSFDPLSLLAGHGPPRPVRGPSLDGESLARTAGAYRFVELGLFEVLSSVPATAPKGVGIAAATASSHHGWHSQLWAERLASLGVADAGSLTLPPSEGFAEVFSWLGSESRGALEKLVGVYRVVLPRLFISYQLHSEAAVGVADAPFARALRLVLAEESRWIWQGEASVLTLIEDASAVEVACSVQRELENMLGPWRSGQKPSGPAGRS